MEAPTTNYGLLSQIVSSNDTLRPSEKKVSSVIVADPAWTSRATLAEIALQAGVSEPSVLRFARSLGFEGFQDFKYALIQSLAAGIPAAHASVERGDSIATITNKVFEHSIDSLRRTREELDQAALDAAIRSIESSTNMLVLGFGASGIVGQDAAQKFPLFGIPINAPIDYHQQFIAANLVDSETVVLAISNTAKTIEVLESVREAKKRGSTIIALCGRRGPISELADIVILHSAEDTDIYTPTASRLAALVIIDVLAVGVAVHQETSRIADLERMKTQLSSLRQGIRSTSRSVSDPLDQQPSGSNGSA
jgi:RpiR family carbohydrate utilization transcriptional regulator